MSALRIAAIVSALVACGSRSHGTSDASGVAPNDAAPADASVGSDAGMIGGGAITCPSPGNPTQNGSSCGTERWNVKTGTDSQAPSLSLVPMPNTIATLVALPAAGAGSARETPTETTLWELKDVTLTELKEESDSDYHLVISDGAHTMIAEIPWPACAKNSPWTCFISRARSEIDAKYTVTSSPQYPSVTITLRGFGFFDYPHGQNGVAPNAIELHPVLQLCFGQGCTPT
jgi:hypothetical protein